MFDLIPYAIFPLQRILGFSILRFRQVDSFKLAFRFPHFLRVTILEFPYRSVSQSVRHTSPERRDEVSGGGGRENIF